MVTARAGAARAGAAQTAVVVAALVVAGACVAPVQTRAASGRLVEELAAAEARVRASAGAAELRRAGLLRWMHGDRLGGERLLFQALLRDPDDARARLGLALMLDDQLRDDEALSHWRRLVERAVRAPSDLWARAAAAHALRRLASFADERRPDVEAFLRATAWSPDTPSDLAVAALRALAAFVDRGGDDAASRRLAEARGCAPAWMRYPPSRPAHLALLSPAVRPPQPPHGGAVRRVVAPRCALVVRSPDGRAGRHLFETFLVSDAEREVELELEVEDADALARVWIGETLVLGRDSARRYFPARMSVRVGLRAGASRVSLELATLGNPERVSLFLRDPKTGRRPVGVRFVDDPRAPPSGARAPRARFLGVAPGPALPWAEDLADSVLLDQLVAWAALERRDADTAEEALARVAKVAPRWAPGLVARALLARVQPARPRAARRDRARAWLAEAIAADPAAARIRVLLAETLLEEDDGDAALDVLGPRPAPRDRHWRLAWSRIRALEARGRETEADEVLAATPAPGACPLVSHRIARARSRGGPVDGRSAAALIACDGDTELLAERAEAAGQHETAVAERARLASRRPDEPSAWIALGRAQNAAGDRERSVESFERAVDVAPRDSSARLALADVHAAVGDVAGARAILEEGIARAPERRELAQALVALGGEDPIARFRIDGAKVIAAFEDDERAGRRPPYRSPAVLVLDRTVVYVLSSGARLTLTHNIIQVLEKEGLDRWGEIQVPDGAELLAARTIKRNGETREPENLAKTGLTAPDLAVGDYVEVEYLVVEPPSATFPGGFVGDRFYFASFEAPLDRTELVVVAPEGYPVEFDARAGAPTPTITTERGLRVTTFAARGRPQLVAEPHGPPIAETVPNVLPYARVDRDAWRTWLIEQTYAARRADRSVRRAARSVTAGAKDDRERVARLYAYVTSRIEEGGSLVEEPAAILARRRGSRAVLFMAMCEAVGIPAELWMARPLSSGVGPPAPPDVGELAYPLVRVAIGGRSGGGVIIDLGRRYAPMGQLDPALLGAPALPVPDPERGPPPGRWPPARLVALPGPTSDPARPEGGTARVSAGWNVVPDIGTDDERQVSLEVELAPDGSAVVAAEERLVGAVAATWREILSRMPRAEIPRELEQRGLGFHFPGIAVESFSVEGEADLARPLVFRYQFRVPHYARRATDGSWELPSSPMPLLLSRRYAALPVRKTPLVLLEASAVTRTLVRVRLPSGMSPSGALPAALESEAPAGAGYFRRAVVAEGAFLVATIEARIRPFSRVLPVDYPAFVRFAGRVDAAEAEAIRVRAASSPRACRAARGGT